MEEAELEFLNRKVIMTIYALSVGRQILKSMTQKSVLNH